VAKGAKTDRSDSEGSAGEGKETTTVAPARREQDAAPELPEGKGKKRKRRGGGQKSGPARQYNARGKRKDNAGGDH
jgi:hypothetical protein